MPSAALMLGAAFGLATLGDVSGAGWLRGLKLAAVAIVADAVWSMARSLCPDRPRAALALVSAAFLLAFQGAWAQLLPLGAGGLWGLWWFRHPAAPPAPEGAPARSRFAWAWLAIFALLLVLLPVAAAMAPGSSLDVARAFYQSGSLVFGGGHVVLPLLDGQTVATGWVDPHTFLAGYALAQALPGPLFAFSAYLGAVIDAGPGGVAGGLVALTAIYLPSWLLVLGTLPYWERLRRSAAAPGFLMGANAAVVGLLLAALYHPVATSAITEVPHAAFALIAFTLLRLGRLPPWAVVGLCAATGQLLW